MRINKPNSGVLMVIIGGHNNRVPADRILIKRNYIEITLKGDIRSIFYVEANIGKAITHKNKLFMH